MISRKSVTAIKNTMNVPSDDTQPINIVLAPSNWSINDLPINCVY